MGQVSVVIAGGERIGMIFVRELPIRGIACMFAEANHTTSIYPKMDVINARSMQLLTWHGDSVPAQRAARIIRRSLGHA